MFHLFGRMARNDPVSSDAVSSDEHLPNLVTIVGQGLPASYELTVDGELTMVTDDPLEEAVVVSGSTAEGAIESDVQRFRFSGELANVTFINEDGPAKPPLVPCVNVGYNVPSTE